VYRLQPDSSFIFISEWKETKAHSVEKRRKRQTESLDSEQLQAKACTPNSEQLQAKACTPNSEQLQAKACTPNLLAGA